MGLLKALPILLPAVAVLFGCAPPSVDPPPGPEKAKAKPKVAVDLPPTIVLEGSLPPERHADENFRIDGLLARHEKHMGKTVQVKGFLVEKSTCPPKAEKCASPHIFLADMPSEEGKPPPTKRMMAVKFEEKALKKLKIGDEYIVMGRLAQRSPDGFVRSKGLIITEEFRRSDETEQPKK